MINRRDIKMKIVLIFGGKVFSGAEITTLRFAQALPKDWITYSCIDPNIEERAVPFGLKTIGWSALSANKDSLLRASHFISEPEQENHICNPSREQLRGILKNLKPDIVVACMFPVAMLAMPVLQKMDIPLVIHHQLMYKDLPDHPIIKPVLRTSNYAAKIIAASEAVALPLRRSGIHNLEVVYAGLPEDYANDDAEPRHSEIPVIIAVGTWGPVKGLDYLVAAADRLHTSGKKFRLDIVGPLGEYGPEYETKIRTSVAAGLKAGYIRLCGPSDDPRKYYREANFLVVPSSEPDPFPTVTIEAMAHGLPVIATAIGGLTEQVIEGQTGLLVPPRDSNALADACAKLLDKPAEASEMGTRALTRQKIYFNLEKQTEKFCRELSTALS